MIKKAKVLSHAHSSMMITIKFARVCIKLVTNQTVIITNSICIHTNNDVCFIVENMNHMSYSNKSRIHMSIVYSYILYMYICLYLHLHIELGTALLTALKTKQGTRVSRVSAVFHCHRLCARNVALNWTIDP